MSRPARTRKRTPTAARRGISLVETILAASMSSMLVYLVAMSWGGFTRGAALISARAELVREGDLAVARLADDLRAVGGWSFDDAPCLSHVDSSHILKLSGVLGNAGTPRDVCYFVEAERLVRHEGPPEGEDPAAAAPPPEAVARLVVELGLTPIDPVVAVGEGPQPARSLYDVALRLQMPQPAGGRRPVENRRTGQVLERRRHLLVTLP